MKNFIQITFFGSSSKRKNMFAVQKIANGAPLALNLYKTQCRTSFLGTPPRVRVSFTEKMLHGVALYVGLMAIPLYIACNVKNYNAAKG